MATKKRTVSVRLDDRAKLRVERAAKIMKQSLGAFLEKAGEERAKAVLLEWAVTRHWLGEASFSELAEEAGLTVEEIMRAASDPEKADAVEMFLASCRVVAESRNNPEFLRQAQEAVKLVE